MLLLMMDTKSLEGNTAPEDKTVFSLRQRGWKIIEQSSFVDSRPGLAPYQNLRRDVQVVKYRLQHDEKVMMCIVEYDSQRDLISESCATDELVIERKEHK